MLVYDLVLGAPVKEYQRLYQYILFLISVHNTNTVVTSSSTVAVNSILSFWFVCFVFKPKGILAAADILQLAQYVSLANM